MVARLIEAICLTFSNLIFAVPAYSAFQKSIWYEASIYTTIVIVSGTYHWIKAMDTCIFTWHNHCYGGYKVMFFLDHYFSYAILTSAVFLILYPTTSGVHEVKRNVNAAVKAVSNTFLSVITIFLLLELDEDDFGVIIMGLSIFCLIYLAVAVFIFKVQITIEPCDFAFALIFLAISVTMYVMDLVFTGYYWILHSLWHLFMGITLSMVVESKKDMWKFIKWVFGCYEYVPENQYVVIRRITFN